MITHNLLQIHFVTRSSLFLNPPKVDQKQHHTVRLIATYVHVSVANLFRGVLYILKFAVSEILSTCCIRASFCLCSFKHLYDQILALCLLYSSHSQSSYKDQLEKKGWWNWSLKTWVALCGKYSMCNGSLFPYTICKCAWYILSFCRFPDTWTQGGTSALYVLLWNIGIPVKSFGLPYSATCRIHRNQGRSIFTHCARK